MSAAEVRECLSHLDTDQSWRDREGDVWTFNKRIGWTWSRHGEVLNEPGTPSPIDGPYFETEGTPA